VEQGEFFNYFISLFFFPPLWENVLYISVVEEESNYFSNTAIPLGKSGAIFLDDFSVNLNNNKDLDCSHVFFWFIDMLHCKRYFVSFFVFFFFLSLTGMASVFRT
jgi:hypothetical protein